MPQRNDVQVLHLTLHRQWFDQIVSGEKKTEYREVKPYWTKRIEGREYDEIHFRNGYLKNAPFMRVKYKGWKFRQIDGSTYYALQLGSILELKNYQVEKGK